jgi:hypothetical protein
MLLALSACSLVHQRAEESGPQSRPGGDEGMLLFTVGRISFEAPAAWEATGDARHVTLVAPGSDGRIDAQLGEKTFKTDDECLAQAQESLSRGASHLTNVRRHPTTFAGRKAVMQEADQQGWHGWAWAVCDGGEQYRLFFTGRSPLKDDAVRAVRLLSSSATLTGPSA